jgi:hypothetical protein
MALIKETSVYPTASQWDGEFVYYGHMLITSGDDMLNTSRLRRSSLGFILLCILLTYPLIGMAASHLEPLPERFDLQNIDGAVYFGTVKNQGDIGNCYGFAATVGSETSSASYTIKKVATQGRSLDICESDKQVPIKRSLLSVSIRAGFSSIDVLGGVAPEEF